MVSHDAQPDNLPDHQMLLMLTRDISTLVKTHAALAGTKPRRVVKDQISRELAGVIADLETIRLGLK